MTLRQSTTTSRRLWQLAEAVHSPVYFAPNAKAIYADAGLKGYWMGYFASRAAALGPVPASVVEALFYNFHPKMVRRAIPDAWSFSSPERVLEARYAIADGVLSEAWAAIDVAVLEELAESLKGVVAACPSDGRALFAAHAALDLPESPALQVWHACTALREFRGDTHVAALVAANIGGLEAHVTAVAAGTGTRISIEPHRGWSPEDWDAADQRLRERGLLTPDERLTPQGRDLRDWIERVTDEISLRPWETLGPAGIERVVERLQGPVDAVLRYGVLPFPNPMGLPKPA